MMLLVALSERPGQLWTREELLARLWAGAAASDECLTRIVYLLRKALKQVGATGASIRTMAKLGYQLEAEVREVDAGARSTDPRHPGFPPFSAAVLPVVDQSANGDAQFLADGLTRDLTMLLAR
ncbi:MAG: winged helix-turn-helix domain-containing protein, partial [Xanthomonadales bacterium]|nr:winged helix-turn-helix domain-containing protein [Xanthomonadales bacterium]